MPRSYIEQAQYRNLTKPMAPMRLSEEIRQQFNIDEGIVGTSPLVQTLSWRQRTSTVQEVQGASSIAPSDVSGMESVELSCDTSEGGSVCERPESPPRSLRSSATPRMSDREGDGEVQAVEVSERVAIVHVASSQWSVLRVHDALYCRTIAVTSPTFFPCLGFPVG